MYFPLKTSLCISLLSVCALAGVGGSLGLRSLTAVARKSHNLLERGVVDFAPQWDPEFHYIDEDSLASDSPFAARLGFVSKQPVLSLEDVEEHLENIRCSETSIEISFRSTHHCHRAKDAWEKLEGFLVVTSHPGCNYNGERSPYLVSGVTFDEDQSTVLLSTKLIKWKDTFHSMTVDFGISSEVYNFEDVRRYRSLHKRQEETTSSAEASSTSSSRPSKSFPVAPTNLPSAENATKDLSFSQVGTQIIPPTFPGADLFTPEGLVVVCKNCSVKGTIGITHGSFTVDNGLPDILNFLDAGFVMLTADGLSAHVELETAVQASQPLDEIEVNLLVVPIPISPFQIPGVASVGAFFNPSLVASVNINGGFNFTYGFDVSVPDKSHITIDISNITNSSTSGFGKTQVKALPFRSTLPNVGLTFSIGFRPQVLLGVEILDGLGEADVRFFLDLPQVSVTIERLSNVAKNCLPSNATSKIGDQLGHIFGNLTHISPSVNLNVGVGAKADIKVAGQGPSIATDWTIASTGFPLPTACLSYDSKAASYAPASDPPVTTTTTVSTATKSKTSTAIAAGNKVKAGAAARSRSPFGELWRICSTIVVVIFMTL